MDNANGNPLAPARTNADWEAQGWATESEPVTAAPRLETTVSIRFDPESAALLRRAALLKGLTKSQFVRQTTLEEARKTIEENPFGLLAQDAVAQYRAGQNKSLKAFAAENGFTLDDE